MRKEIRNEEYVSGIDALYEFYCETEHKLAKWRSEGMPYVKGEGRVKFWYPVERCRAWFRGEEE